MLGRGEPVEPRARLFGGGTVAHFGAGAEVGMCAQQLQLFVRRCGLYFLDEARAEIVE